MPRDHFVELPALRVRTRVWDGPPDRPPLVLLPATGATAEDWDVVAAAASQTRAVHAVDLRGHGSSDWPGTYSIELMAEDVIGLLEHVGTAGVVDLVGHSLGGLVACRVAARAPHLVRRLVLEDVGVLRPRVVDPPARPDGELGFDWAVVEQVRPEIDQPSPDWPEVFAAIAAPTLVVSGGSASPVAPDQVAALVDLVPHARSVVIEAGHLVHEHAPERFTDVVLRFLDAS